MSALNILSVLTPTVPATAAVDASAVQGDAGAGLFADLLAQVAPAPAPSQAAEVTAPQTASILPFGLAAPVAPAEKDEATTVPADVAALAAAQAAPLPVPAPVQPPVTTASSDGQADGRPGAQIAPAAAQHLAAQDASADAAPAEGQDAPSPQSSAPAQTPGQAQAQTQTLSSAQAQTQPSAVAPVVSAEAAPNAPAAEPSAQTQAQTQTQTQAQAQSAQSPTAQAQTARPQVDDAALVAALARMAAPPSASVFKSSLQAPILPQVADTAAEDAEPALVGQAPAEAQSTAEARPAQAQSAAQASAQAPVPAPAPSRLRGGENRVDPDRLSNAETATGALLSDGQARVEGAGAAPAPRPAEQASAQPTPLQTAAVEDDAPPPADLSPAASGDAANAGSTAAAPERHGAASMLSRATVETTAQIAAQIIRKLDGRSTRFDMALTPDDLGRVDVSMKIEADGRLTAVLAADSAAASAELRSRADDLRRQLQDAGFELSQDSLQFAERDASSGFGGGQGFDRAPDRRAFAGAARLAAEADLAAPASGAWTTLSLTPDRVDLKV
ncbi:flagellar hook-length control protein FliK [Brevundimonas faecalis]|uniref:Flagellar hook-length control protein FliK n=1 Tax=Brevundimonas faecalis TaxID=947378 RepID=A0ABV2R8H3_9CAUL